MRQRLRVAGNQPADLVDARMPGVEPCTDPRSRGCRARAATGAGCREARARQRSRRAEPFARAVSMKFARAGISTTSSRPRLSPRGVCSSTPANPASPISAMRSGSKPSSAKTTPRNLDAARNVCSAPRCAPPASRLAPGRPRRSPLLHRPCPSPLPRERQAAIEACPAIALTGRRPFTAATVARTTSAETARERPVRIAQIDDVGAVRNRDLGVLRTAHAGEHQGHWSAFIPIANGALSCRT